MTTHEIKSKLYDLFVYLEGEDTPPTPFQVLDSLKEFRTEYLEYFMNGYIAYVQKNEKAK